MINLTQEQVAILNLIECEVQKYFKKHKKSIKKSFKKVEAEIEAFCNKINKMYIYNHFTIDECKKIKHKNIKELKCIV